MRKPETIISFFFYISTENLLFEDFVLNHKKSFTRKSYIILLKENVAFIQYYCLEHFDNVAPLF